MTASPVFVFSILSPASLTDEVRVRYGLDVTSSRLLRSGLNDTYLLTDAANERYIARVYRLNGRTDDEIEFELDFIEHLREKGIGVCPAITTRDGERTWLISCAEGKRKVMLSRFAPGEEIVLADHDAVRAFAASVAALHAASIDFRPAGPAPLLAMDNLLQVPLRTLHATGLIPEDNMNQLDRIGEELTGEFAKLGASQWSLNFCHGDLHGQNAHRTANGNITHFDFDFSNQGWHAYDLAVFRWSAWINKDKDRWEPFISEYTAHQPVDATAFKAMPLLAALRHFFHMGVLCRLAPQSGSGFLNRVVIERQIKFVQGLIEEYASDSAPS